MPKNTNIFREVSLERLSSPEQLDQLLQVTTPRGWVALLGVGVLVAAAVVWSLVSVLPETVAGRGVLIKTGGVSDIAAVGDGRVVDVAVRAGDVVSAGQVVARIHRPDLIEALAQARAKLRELKARGHSDAAFDRQDGSLRLGVLERKRAVLRQSVDAARERVQWLTRKRTARERLLGDGLITRQQLIDTEQRLEQARRDVDRTQADLQSIDVEILQLRNTKARTARKRRFDVDTQARQIEQLEAELQRRSRVVSAHRGRILEVTAEKGDFVRMGEPMMSFHEEGPDVKRLEAVLYVSGREGKRIRPGMQVQIAPATVRPEEYGRMLGTVTYVSDFPATPRGMQRLLGNEQLVRSLSQGGAPYEVYADVTLDPDTPSRYRWTSSSGPPEAIRSGTLCASTITVKERRPIAFVLPLLRSAVGIE